MSMKNTVSLVVGLALGVGIAAAAGAWAQGAGSFGPGMMMGGYGMMGGAGAPAAYTRHAGAYGTGITQMREVCLNTMQAYTGTPAKTTGK